jgi:serine/threonine-protein kinase
MANLVGKTLCDRYFLRELIGSGGTADVYQAWDNLRSTRMAIKVLRHDLAISPRFFQMFAKEAELLRKLEHPNIVRLYEFEKDKDVVFIVMDWVEGSNLRQSITNRHRPFSLEETSHILQPVCSALNYAHQQKVFHCDVKPANILLHVDGRVLLNDFGVARLAHEQTGGGTPPYMAPEQFTKKPADARTDIYALGVTLYEMFSGGQVPYRGDSPDSPGSTTRERIAWEHLNLPLPPLRQFNPGLLEGIELVIQTAMSKEPAQRYATAMDFQKAFEHARMESGRRGSEPRTIIQPLLPQPPPKKEYTPVSPARSTSGAQRKAPHLVARSGDLAGQIVPIPASGLTIGRSTSTQLRLREPSVSRNHAVIIVARRGVYIRDEGSSLGTIVNGQRIPAGAPVLLRHGDVIQVGYYQVFEYRVK